MNQASDVAKTVATGLGAFDERAAKREKTWEECSADERIDRLRQELLMQREMNEYTARTASNADQLSRNHQHSHTGEVLRPANSGGNALMGEGRRDLLK